MQFASHIDGPVAVIGDVHGQIDQLARLLDRLSRLPDYDARWIVFIGDLVDRGPDPRGAIDMVLDLHAAHSRTTAIAGNHELAMAASLGLVPTPAYSNWTQRWLDHYGSQSTFASYGVEPGQLDVLKSEIPESHQQYLADVPWSVEHPQYFFVHAGLSPQQPFKMQAAILRQRDFSLNRPEWLCSKSLPFEGNPQDCPSTVVSGHVCVPEVQFRPGKILVDTTGGEGGELSCVLLPEKKVISSGSGNKGNKHGSGHRPTGQQPVETAGARKGWFGLW